MLRCGGRQVAMASRAGPPITPYSKINLGRYDQAVSNPSLPPPAQPPPTPWQPQGPGPHVQKRPATWVAVVALIVALIALGVAISSWFRPAPTNQAAVAAAFTNKEVAEAKSAVCNAISKVHNAIQLTGARDRGSDYSTQLASAVNARQALIAGNQYLSTILGDNPATPPDIAKEIRNLTRVYQLLTVQLLEEAPDADINTSVGAGDAATSKLENLCK